MRLTKEELGRVQELNNSFTQAKLALGELELKRHGMLQEMEKLRQTFGVEEQKLISKYGADSVINLKTEVTEKEKYYVKNSNTTAYPTTAPASGDLLMGTDINDSNAAKHLRLVL